MPTKTKIPEVSGVDTKEIQAYKAQITKAEKFSTSLEVTTDEDYLAALSEGRHIKEQLEIITARKEQITKPLNAALKSVRDLFKPLETAGDTALRTIKSKMLSFTSEKERKAEEAKKKLAERVERGTMRPETAVAKISAIEAPEKTIVSDEGSATTKTVTKFRVVDITKVPVEFLIVDMARVRASFRAGIPVNGIELVLEKELSLS